MTRPIKFRAWDTVQEHWQIFEKEDFYKPSHSLEGDNERYINWGEFTGLHDKNGKEIYEGDIIKWSDCGDVDGVSAVEWDAENTCFTLKPSYDNGGGYDPTLGACGESGEFEMEVLGNIWEHPELLK